METKKCILYYPKEVFKAGIVKKLLELRMKDLVSFAGFFSSPVGSSVNPTNENDDTWKKLDNCSKK